MKMCEWCEALPARKKYCSSKCATSASNARWYARVRDDEGFKEHRRQVTQAWRDAH